MNSRFGMHLHSYSPNIVLSKTSISSWDFWVIHDVSKQNDQHDPNTRDKYTTRWWNGSAGMGGHGTHRCERERECVCVWKWCITHYYMVLPDMEMVYNSSEVFPLFQSHVGHFWCSGPSGTMRCPGNYIKNSFRKSWNCKTIHWYPLFDINYKPPG